MRRTTILLVSLLLLSLPALAEEQKDALPTPVQSQAKGLEPIGTGTYRKFGFSVYYATLWAKDKNYDPKKPYALELRYTRGVSKDTLVDTVVDDIREQNVADENTISRWQATLKQDLPAVEEDDVLVGLCVPGKKSQLYYNGTQIASISDQDLSKAFFNVWLGDTADESLRAKLLGKEE